MVAISSPSPIRTNYIYIQIKVDGSNVYNSFLFFCTTMSKIRNTGISSIYLA